jgi:hypothetical protein
VSGDVLPTIVGIVLVAAAAAFALLPFARGSSAPIIDAAVPELPPTDRFDLYRQVMELEFDLHLGKITDDDYQLLSSELLAQAGAALQAEKGSLGEIDAEIEREIAAARAAFAAARQSAGVGS